METTLIPDATSGSRVFSNEALSISEGLRLRGSVGPLVTDQAYASEALVYLPHEVGVVENRVQLGRRQAIRDAGLLGNCIAVQPPFGQREVRGVLHQRVGVLPRHA